MPEIDSVLTIDSVMRARNSARRRRSTLRKTRSRYSTRQSPLMDVAGVFDRDVEDIERIYDNILTRIDNARVIL